MDSSHKEALLVLSYLYLQNLKFDKASHLLTALKKLHPEDLYIRKLLALAHLHNQNPSSALQEAEACLTADASPESKLSSQTIMAKALWKLGEEEQSNTLLQSIIQQKQLLKIKKDIQWTIFLKKPKASYWNAHAITTFSWRSYS